MEKIKQLAVRIDELSQLTKGLSSPVFIDMSRLPTQYSTEEVIRIMSQQGIMSAENSEPPTISHCVNIKEAHNAFRLAKKWLELSYETEPSTYTQKEFEVSDYTQLYTPAQKIAHIQEQAQQIILEFKGIQEQRGWDFTIEQHLNEAVFYLDFELERFRSF